MGKAADQYVSEQRENLAMVLMQVTINVISHVDLPAIAYFVHRQVLELRPVHHWPAEDQARALYPRQCTRARGPGRDGGSAVRAGPGPTDDGNRP